jgi:hypothetical protein
MSHCHSLRSLGLFLFVTPLTAAVAAASPTRVEVPGDPLSAMREAAIEKADTAPPIAAPRRAPTGTDPAPDSRQRERMAVSEAHRAAVQAAADEGRRRRLGWDRRAAGAPGAMHYGRSSTPGRDPVEPVHATQGGGGAHDSDPGVGNGNGNGNGNGGGGNPHSTGPQPPPHGMPGGHK